jgi:hypothetical protein
MEPKLIILLYSTFLYTTTRDDEMKEKKQVDFIEIKNENIESHCTQRNEGIFFFDFIEIKNENIETHCTQLELNFELKFNLNLTY